MELEQVLCLFLWNFCTVVELLCVCSCLCYSATHKMTTEETSTHYLHFLDVLGLVQTLRALQRRPEDRNSETFAIVCSLV